MASYCCQYSCIVTEIEVISNLSIIQIIQHIFVIEVKRKMEHLYNLGIKVEPDIYMTTRISKESDRKIPRAR